MRFDWVYVNPFHAAGFSGSLYAVQDYYRLNAIFRGASAQSDDDLLRGFVEAARSRGIGVMMDLVVNHTAKDARLSGEHPEWYRREEDGSIASPFAVDPSDTSKRTVWGDLAELDYTDRPERAAMTAYYADVVRHYVHLGFRGFRCDAAYKVPGAVWSDLIRAAREIEPDTFFAAETLGSRIEEVTQLGDAGFDYLFNSSKWWDFKSPWLLDQYEQFRHIAPSIAFPESHDTPRLAAEFAGRSLTEIEAEYRFRYLFAAFFSAGIMMPIGYEFGFGTAVNVVETTPEHWETPRFDISHFITEVNEMKASVPALNEEGAQRLVAGGERFPIALVRNASSQSGYALAVINPDPSGPAEIDAAELLRALDGDGAPRDVTPDENVVTLDRDAHLVLGPLEMRVYAPEPSTNGHAAANSAIELHGSGPRGDVRLDARPVIIENVWPEIDAGRHPVKRVVGDTLEVQADIFREGHDHIAATLKYRELGSTRWRENAMTLFDNDRWRGAFRLERNTRYEYTIEAWPDDFETWRHDVGKKRDAGQAIGLELTEGRILVERARDRAERSERLRLETTLRECDFVDGDDEIANILLSDSLAHVMERVPDRALATEYARTLEVIADRLAARFSTWYEFFPRSQGTQPHVSSTFTEAQRRLPDIRSMGFDVLYLPPIHPIGHAFRKGKNNSLDPGPDDPGSPWAIGNETGGHIAVEPSIGTIEEFDRFVAAARAHGIEIALDYALQCSPDHPYVKEHPEWFTIRPDGSIKYAENPPKKYQDIVNFNWYGPHAPALWDELRDVVLFWVEHGVRIFRVDNPHTKPFAYWEWMIGEVQSRFPDVLFLAEAFTRPKIMKELAKVGFTQSYTYFTWRNFKAEITDYSNELAYSEMGEYYRPNFFANTPDILPPFLQTGGRPAFLIRLVLAATLSSVYGIYSGFELCENAALPGREEYLDSEKYEIRVRDWDMPGNIKPEIARINAIRRDNPALHDWRNCRFHQADDDAVIFFSKNKGNNTILVAVNLDPFEVKETTLRFPIGDFGLTEGETFECEELLSGQKHLWRGDAHSVRLDPHTNPAAVYRVSTRMNVDYGTPSF